MSVIHEQDIKEITSFSKVIASMKMITLSISITALILVLVIYLLFLNSSTDMQKQVMQARSEHFVIEPSSGQIMKGSFRALNDADMMNIKKGLVARFASLVYQFDGETFRDNLKASVNYSSQDVANIFLSDYLSSEFDLSHRLKDEKMAWYISVDSIKINSDNTGFLYAKHRVVKPFGQRKTNLVCQFQIRQIDKVTEKNEYAAVIDKWQKVSQTETQPQQEQQ